MHLFDQGTDLERLGDGRYRGWLDRTWWIDFGPNGGFLASLMLKAVVASVDNAARKPRSLSVHYPGRAREGVFEIEVALERSGRTMTFATARMYQDGRLLTLAQCALSDDRRSAEFDHAAMPDVAGPDDIPEVAIPAALLPRFARNFEYRWALGAFPYSRADNAEIGGWIRPKPPRRVDELILPTFADGFPPAAFVRASEPFPIPTVDLTVHFRAELPRPEIAEDDWCLARFRSRRGAGGFVEEDGEIWARDGALIAQSRQLAIYGTEPGEAGFGDAS